MATKRSKRSRTKHGVTLATLRKLAMRLPEVEEGTSYGTLAFRVKGKLLARLRDDDESLALRSDFDERAILIEADPDTYFITDHYLNHPMLLVHLSVIEAGELEALLEESWRRVAPKRALAAFDAR
jgi:hypothetical protein